MKNKNLKLKLMLFLLGTGMTLHAQQSATASGGDASGSSGTSSYTVGQVCYTSNTVTGGFISEGVQQAFEIFNTGITENSTRNILFKIFPNPAFDILTLQVSNFQNENLTYQIYDLKGKKMESNSLHGYQTHINLTNYTGAVYIVIIMQDNKIVNQFKIIKK